MSAALPSRFALGTVAVAILATAVGIPVGSWAAAVAMVFFLLFICARMVGAESAAKGFASIAITAFAAAILLPMLGGGVRSLLHETVVQAALGALCLIVAVVGGLVLTSKALALKPTKRVIPRFPVRERTAIAEPVGLNEAFGHATPHRDVLVDTEDRKARRAPTDDLGLFGGSRRRG